LPIKYGEFVLRNALAIAGGKEDGFKGF